MKSRLAQKASSLRYDAEPIRDVIVPPSRRRSAWSGTPAVNGASAAGCARTRPNLFTRSAFSLPCAFARRPSMLAAARSQLSEGSEKKNVLPSPGVLSAQMRPP